MSNKWFYWLACIGFVLFSGEAYLFTSSNFSESLFAHVFNKVDIAEEVEQIPVDDASAHEDVDVKPAEPKPLEQPVVTEKPIVTEESVPEVKPKPDVVVHSHELKLPELSQDTHQYDRVVPTTFPKTSSGKPLQFIVFAFDGSGSLSSWDKTYAFAQDMRKTGNHFSFTYFINPVYLLTSENKDVYMSPDGDVGASAIGFGGSESDIKLRINAINRAIHDGHDIESHAVGHWNGSKFSNEQWVHELESFSKLIFGTEALYPGYAIELNPKDLIGFRAPELARNTNMYTALKDLGYRYDTSKVQTSPAWPKKEEGGIWEFPLDLIKRGTSGKNVLAMDFNFYFIQTNAKSTARRSTPQWNSLYQEVLISYQNYFQSHYDGNRAPVYVANHFGFWNDGLYWEAMKQTAKDLCGKPDVFCGSYRDLFDYMELHPELEGLK